MVDILAYIFMVENGDIDITKQNVLSLTWLEEWCLYP
jgi:hypothetical protein